MRTFTELYEPKFHKLAKIKIQGALFMPNFPIPKPGIRTDSFKNGSILIMVFRDVSDVLGSIRLWAWPKTSQPEGLNIIENI